MQDGMPQNARWNVYSCILYVGFLGAVNGKEGYAWRKNVLKKVVF